MTSPNWDQTILESVRTSVEILRKMDQPLFDLDANERSITHKLAIYLQLFFPTWDIDCEYNRIGDARTSKRLTGLIEMKETDDTKGATIYPDIIIHRRKERDRRNNLLAIEVKKERLAEEKDIIKLQAYTHYSYQYGIFLGLLPTGENYYVRFLKGKEEDDINDPPRF